MKILIVGLVKNNQLKRLQIEGAKLGHSVDGCFSSDLSILAQKDNFKVSLTGYDIASYNLIYLWAVGKRRWEWYTACLYLSKTTNVMIVNAKVIDTTYNYYLTPAADYLKQFENKLNFPMSLVVFGTKGLEEKLVDFTFPVIVKVANGRQGRGIYKVENMADLHLKVGEITKDGPCVIRQFIPNEGDIRVFTVGYKAIGAMKRIPKQGDFRSNISQGGSGVLYDLNENLQITSMAEELSRLTKTQIAGVDIMLDINTQTPYILEINPGPQFTGFEKYTGINAAESIIKYFESLV